MLASHCANTFAQILSKFHFEEKLDYFLPSSRKDWYKRRGIYSWVINFFEMRRKIPESVDFAISSFSANSVRVMRRGNS
jgi:hypothetical protein